MLILYVTDSVGLVEFLFPAATYLKERVNPPFDEATTLTIDASPFVDTEEPKLFPLHPHTFPLT